MQEEEKKHLLIILLSSDKTKIYFLLKSKWIIKIINKKIIINYL